MLENFSKLIQIDEKWISKYLVDHGITDTPKLKIRAYSVAFSGTQQEHTDLIYYLVNNIEKYVFNESKIKEIKQSGKIPYREASKLFGDVNPQTDGKYGELMLFCLVEALLKVPMIAHKLPILTNPNDQVKGSDGIFMGQYGDKQALFIGESKIKTERSKAISESLKSINKFHGDLSSGSKLHHELFIARENLVNKLKDEEYEEVYQHIHKSLIPSSKEYKEKIKVHPILIVYQCNKINEIEKVGLDNKECEVLISSYMKTEKENIEIYLNKLLNKEYPNLRSIYFDFFFIPIKEVNKFRDEFYYQIHLTPYKYKDGDLDEK